VVWGGPASQSVIMTEAYLRTRMTLGERHIFHAGRGLLSTSRTAPPVEGNGVRTFPITDGTNECGIGYGHPMACPEWVAPLDGTAATSPVLSPDQATVFVGTNAGTIYGVDADTGTVRWSAPAGMSVPAPPALANGVLYVPTGSGELVAFDADGCGAATCAPLWSGSVGGSLDVQPAVAGGVVYAGSSSGTVRAFPAAGCGASTCAAIWSTNAGSAITGAPAVSLGRLFVGTLDGRLIAYAPSS
jgi:outer membrane protein assembly factor BamB